MELGETVEAAAQRESKEEIGCRVELTGVPQLYSYEDAAVVTIVYDAKVVGRGPRPGPESLEVRAFSAADIPWEDLAFRSTFHALRDWAKRVSRGGTKPVKT
jgi:ADP-ribose pyrophosphatase YjhB (NUDIX family)